MAGTEFSHNIPQQIWDEFGSRLTRRDARRVGKGALALCVNGGHDRGYGVGHLTRLHSEMTTQKSIKR
jgi:hypothetical protein